MSNATNNDKDLTQVQLNNIYNSLEAVSEALAGLTYSLGETNTLLIRVKKQLEDHIKSPNHPYNY